jgi:GTP1/Obg family GTP-binding protein
MWWSFLIQNSFAMREWPVKHMEKIVVKFVTGLPENATAWEKIQNKRYGKITSICRQISYDIKHGGTIEQVIMLLQKIRNDSSFSSLQKKRWLYGKTKWTR